MQSSSRCFGPHSDPWCWTSLRHRRLSLGRRDSQRTVLSFLKTPVVSASIATVGGGSCGTLKFFQTPCVESWGLPRKASAAFLIKASTACSLLPDNWRDALPSVVCALHVKNTRLAVMSVWLALLQSGRHSSTCLVLPIPEDRHGWVDNQVLEAIRCSWKKHFAFLLICCSGARYFSDAMIARLLGPPCKGGP